MSGAIILISVMGLFLLLFLGAGVAFYLYKQKMEDEEKDATTPTGPTGPATPTDPTDPSDTTPTDPSDPSGPADINWGEWGECSVLCGGGTRTRSCTGEDCLVEEETEPCNDERCIPTGCDDGKILNTTLQTPSGNSIESQYTRCIPSGWSIEDASILGFDGDGHVYYRQDDDLNYECAGNKIGYTGEFNSIPVYQCLNSNDNKPFPNDVLNCGPSSRSKPKDSNNYEWCDKLKTSSEPISDEWVESDGKKFSSIQLSANKPSLTDVSPLPDYNYVKGDFEGNIDKCKQECINDSACRGFSINKYTLNEGDTAGDLCWLYKDTSNQSSDPNWKSYKKPEWMYNSYIKPDKTYQMYDPEYNIDDSELGDLIEKFPIREDKSFDYNNAYCHLRCLNAKDCKGYSINKRILSDDDFEGSQCILNSQNSKTVSGTTDYGIDTGLYNTYKKVLKTDMVKENPELKCSSKTILGKVRTYYNNTLFPNKYKVHYHYLINKVPNEDACDISYEYYGALTKQRGIDNRRFNFEYKNNQWEVVGNNGSNSANSINNKYTTHWKKRGGTGLLKIGSFGISINECTKNCSNDNTCKGITYPRGNTEKGGTYWTGDTPSQAECLKITDENKNNLKIDHSYVTYMKPVSEYA